MNTRQQAIDLSIKMDQLVTANKGILTISFFDGSSKKVKLKHKISNISQDNFTCTLETFTNDINNTTAYDIYQIQDIT